MGFAIFGEHREYFVRNGYVEFESLLTMAELEELGSALRRAMGEDPPSTAAACFCIGRDLWRREPILGKMARSRKVAQIAADLIEKRPLRFAYDQALWRQERFGVSVQDLPQGTVEEFSAFHGVRIALVLCLEGGVTSVPYLPTQPGSGVYVSAQKSLDWQGIAQTQGGLWWCLVYGDERMLYVFNPQAPHAHLPKQYGYGFGDRLRDDEYPLVARN